MFTDHFAGATRNRPALEYLRRYVREVDTVAVHSMDRLARNLDDLRALVHRVHQGRGLGGVRQGGRDLPPAWTPPCRSSCCRCRARPSSGGSGVASGAEGIELAKKRGVNKGRRPALTADRVTELRAQATAGVPKTRLPRQHGIHRDTVYRGRR